MSKKDIQAYIEENGYLLFDGGMGTYYSEKTRRTGEGCEMANLHAPQLITAIHREYLEAGARAIKTNTFAVNGPAFQGDTAAADRVIRAGWRLAEAAAAPSGAFVFADIGPVNGLSPAETAAEYERLAQVFLDLGAEHFLFETNAAAQGLPEAARYIREKAPDAFIIVSFAVLAEGYSRDGFFGEDLLRTVWASGAVDAVGLNCVSGVRQMADLLDQMDTEGLQLSVMPNAGYPVVVRNRTFYESDPAYFGQGIRQIFDRGVRILGGCCGTTPAFIRRAKEALAAGPAVQAARRARPKVVQEDAASPFWEKLTSGKRVMAVEMDPPENADIRGYEDGVRILRAAGADIITIADCPVARARMDSSLMAVHLRREMNMEALPHMTCRDRNLNATKALLLGLSVEGIRNVLLVTGDPVPTAERDEVKSVYQFNSRRMAAFVSGLGQKGQLAPFHIFGALNVNARNFSTQLRIAEEKLENGMCGFLTQPVLSPEGMENLKRAREVLKCRLLGGIMPVVSERNAAFMDSEINGICVSKSIQDRYHGLDRAQAEDLAVSLSTEIAKEMAPYTDGFYVITPFSRWALTGRVVRSIRTAVGD